MPERADCQSVGHIPEGRDRPQPGAGNTAQGPVIHRHAHRLDHWHTGLTHRRWSLQLRRVVRRNVASESLTSSSSTCTRRCAALSFVRRSLRNRSHAAHCVLRPDASSTDCIHSASRASASRLSAIPYRVSLLTVGPKPSPHAVSSIPRNRSRNRAAAPLQGLYPVRRGLGEPSQPSWVLRYCHQAGAPSTVTSTLKGASYANLIRPERPPRCPPRL